MAKNIEQMTNEELVKSYKEIYDLMKMECAGKLEVAYGNSLEREIKNRNGEIYIKIDINFPKE